MLLTPAEANLSLKSARKGVLRRPTRNALLHILYAVGPGDVVDMYRDLIEGRAPSFQPPLAFSQQFLEWCEESGASAHLVSWHGRSGVLEDGPFTVENRPKRLNTSSALKYHFSTLMYGLGIVRQAMRERPTVVVVDSGATHWIVLSLLSMMNVPVIAVFHNALWTMGFQPSRRQRRLFLWLDGLFFRRFAAASACVSPECERQLRTVTGVPHGPIYQFLPQYRHGPMTRVDRVPDHADRPFSVLFLGRIEAYKGVFLILSMAERLEREMPGQFAWKIVGSGADSIELKLQCAELKLDHAVEIPGALPDEQTALETFSWAHAMVVPTTSEFNEGFAMTAAEGILAGRPVVVSTVVPAWEVLGRAAIRAEADNVDSFVNALKRLALDADYYDQCQRASLDAQAQFYDRSRGLGNVLGGAIMAALSAKAR